MHNENMVTYKMEYYSSAKKTEIMNFSGKWVELEKYHIEWGNPEPEKQTAYSLSVEAPSSKFLSVSTYTGVISETMKVKCRVFLG